MKTFHCKYCNRPMKVNALEYKSNPFCNKCFDERARTLNLSQDDLNTFVFMDVTIRLSEDEPKAQKHKR